MKRALCSVLSSVALLGVWAGCASTEPKKEATQVSQAVEAPTPAGGQPAIVLAPDGPTPAPTPATSAPVGPEPTPAYTAEVLASVNGQAVSRDRVVALLIKANGLNALQQLISLDAVEQVAAKKGIRILESDVQGEYQSTLDALAANSFAPDKKPTDDEKRRLLEEVLRRRGMSMDEFMLGMRRNAYLRKLAAKDLSVTEEDLKDEFNRTFGAKVMIRTIVCAKPENIEAARADLLAGKDFADVARKFSEDTLSGPRGGLLPPFAANDSDVPQFMRDAAFALAKNGQPGQISNVIKYRDRYHVIKVEKFIEPELVKFEDYREACRQRLLTRLLPGAMKSQQDLILKQAEIKIFDPTLKEQFEQRSRAPGGAAVPN